MAGISAEEQAKAAEMFAAGKSVNAVAKELFGGQWAKANQARLALGGGQVSAGSRAAKKKKAPKRPVAEAEEDEDWDLTVRVSTCQLDEVWGGLTVGEKAIAIQGALQSRFEAD